ncbi:hypothetical protein C0J52_27612 [Blattella germanica]|nr:hypothetical protein C0J52_27612 [Blattella germanica]
MEYMFPPITLCENGHSLCGCCKLKLRKCPICSGQFLNVRNIILENLAGKVHFPCKFRDHGCELSFDLGSIAHHQESCHHGHYKCPFSLTQIACTWDGPVAYIKTHIKNSHRDPCDAREVSGVHNARLLNFDRYSSWCQTVFTMKEIFFRFSRIIDGFIYSCVLYVGPKDNASKFHYRLTINSLDDKSSVSACHETSWYNDGVQELFHNGKCAVFHKQYARSCMVSDNELVMEEEIFSQPQID